MCMIPIMKKLGDGMDKLLLSLRVGKNGTVVVYVVLFKNSNLYITAQLKQIFYETFTHSVI